MRAHVEQPTYERVLARAGWRCERCAAHASSVHLELHHVLGRQPCGLVNTDDNCLMLCRRCHAWWHEHKLTALEWFGEQFGAERLERLYLIRRGTKHVGAAMEE